MRSRAGDQEKGAIEEGGGKREMMIEGKISGGKDWNIHMDSQ